MERADRPRGEAPWQLGTDIPLARGGAEPDVRGVHREGTGDLGRVHDGQGEAAVDGGAAQPVTDTSARDQAEALGDE